MTKLANTHYKDEVAVNELSSELLKIFNESNDIVIVNIGTDRCIGDTIAPLIGTMLKENNFSFPVYGTLDEPIHALNIDKRMEEIKRKHPNSIIIGIDACLGSQDDIGRVQLRDFPIKPGKGVGKNLVPVGEYSMIGIVDDSDTNELFTNRNIRLSFILNMAKVMSRALLKADKEYYIMNKEVAICNF